MNCSSILQQVNGQFNFIVDDVVGGDDEPNVDEINVGGESIVNNDKPNDDGLDAGEVNVDEAIVGEINIGETSVGGKEHDADDIAVSEEPNADDISGDGNGHNVDEVDVDEGDAFACGDCVDHIFVHNPVPL